MKKPTHRMPAFKCGLCGKDFYDSTYSRLCFTFLICNQCEKNLPNQQDLRKIIKNTLMNLVIDGAIKTEQENQEFEL